jgi:hypothetical protein
MKTKAALDLLTLALAFLLSASSAPAQTTAFTYQGRLTDGGSPANGNYDLQFTLWDSASGGTQQPQPSPVTVTNPSVPVVNGVFTLQIDFGPNAFTGASRFLEISGRPSGTQTFTALVPRQQISSTPYAIRSLSSTSADGLASACVGCVQDAQINQVAGSKVNGTIPLASIPSGNSNYIQNSTTQQSGSNFNISGNGTIGGTLSGNIVNAATQYNINGSRFLSNSGAGVLQNTNTFAGIAAGDANTPGANDATGNLNSFFGAQAGQSNITGYANSFFGYASGALNQVGIGNSFFGEASGRGSTGSYNSFFGLQAGWAGATTLGSSNSFFGYSAGRSNYSGNFDTMIGTAADVAADYLSNATAIGANAFVSQSNSLILGSINGVNAATADTNVGIGTTAPQARLHVVGNSTFATRGTNGVRITPANDSDIGVLNVTNAANTVNWLTVGSNGQVIMNGSGNVGIGTTTPDAKLTVNGSADKPGGGSWGTFSDERLKNIKGRFTPGLKAVMQLQPLRYEYKRDNALGIKFDGEQIGFGAQAVQKIIPEAVTTNDKGYLIVNNDPIMWTMLNAIKEQQSQIETQQEQLKRQQEQLMRQEEQARQERAAFAAQEGELKALKNLVCRSHRRATMCK